VANGLAKFTKGMNLLWTISIFEKEIIAFDDFYKYIDLLIVIYKNL
jgi:hypothetical protein